MDDSAPAPLRADVLGRPRLFRGDTELPIATWHLRSAGELLLFVLTSDGRRADRGAIQAALWGELRPPAATNALYKSVHALRQRLQPELPHGRESAYLRWEGATLTVPSSVGCTIDAAVIVEVSDRLRAGLPVALVEIEHALSLYRGDLLETIEPAGWIDARRAALRQRRTELALALADRATAAGQPERTVPALEALLRADPANVTIRRRLVGALAASGQREAALRVADDDLVHAAGRPDEAPDPEIERLRATLLTVPAPTGVGADGTPAATLPSSVPVPPNPLIGREWESDELRDLLGRDGVRLVTLTGPGGAGKTHLAMATGHALRSRTAGAVAFVPLGPLRYPELVLPAIAAALGLVVKQDGPVLPTLVAAIGQQELLLILDNVEHVLASAPEVAALLAACSRLTVLATSRERLNLRGEHRLEVRPLPTPDRATAPSLLEFGAVASVRLLCDRLRAIEPGFRLTDATAPAVDEICRRLNGLPLALELAAAQIDHADIDEIRDGLGDQLALLVNGPGDAPHRHQTIRACIAWSEDRLAPEARALFRRLCLFDGAFSETMAGWLRPVASGATALPGLRATLRALVRSSLLVRNVEPDRPGDDAASYRILETVRAYGRDRLAADGGAEASRALLRAVRDLSADAEGTFTATTIGATYDRLDALRPTIDAALTFGFGSDEPDDQALAEEIAASLVQFWGERGGFRDAARWFAPLLAIPDGLTLDDWAERHPEAAGRRAKALRRGSMLLYDAERFDDAVRFADRALLLAVALGDQAGQSTATELLAGIASVRGEHDRALVLSDHAVALANASGVERRQRIAETNRLLIVTTAGDLDRAAQLGPVVLARVREADDPDSVAHVALTLTGVHLALGDTAAGAAMVETATAAAAMVDAPHYQGRVLTFRGWIAWLAGDLEGAERSFAAAADAHRSIDDWVAYIHENTHAQGIAALRLGRLPDARDLLGQTALGYLADSDLRGHAATLIEDLVTVATGSATGDASVIQSWLACRLLGAAAATRGRTGQRRPVVDVIGFDERAVTARIERQLGPDRWREEREAGGQLGDGGIAAAIHDLIRLGAPAVPRPRDVRKHVEPGLSAREREVLLLLADGRSSADIAGALFVSERTVHAHLRSIYQKLNVANRAAAIRWSYDHGLIPSPVTAGTVTPAASQAL